MMVNRLRYRRLVRKTRSQESAGVWGRDRSEADSYLVASLGAKRIFLEGAWYREAN